MNVELAQKALEVIKAKPEQHKQSSWFDANGDYRLQVEGFEVDETRNPPCGTKMCYGGYVSLLSTPLGSVIKNGDITFPDGKIEFVDAHAAGALGITPSQAYPLFYSAGDAEDVEKIVNYLIDNPDASENSIYIEALGSIFRYDDDEDDDQF